MTSKDLATNKRAAFREVVDVPIDVLVDGGLHLCAQLMDLSVSGCRFRTAVAVPIQSKIQFTWQRTNQTPLAFRGRITSRRRLTPGLGYDCGVAFEPPLIQSQREEVIAELFTRQRINAHKRAELAAEKKTTTKIAAGGQKRTAFRTRAEFPVTYATADAPRRDARAGDLSAGGMRLITAAPVISRDTLTFIFTLPSDVLDAFPTPKRALIQTPFGPRVRQHEHRSTRPFEKATVRGQIITDFGRIGENWVYGISFIDLDPLIREDIERYVHAVQLLKLRNQKE